MFTARLQQALKLLGYYDGDITGIYDDATRAAVAALQRDLGLPETGEYDEATDAALRERLGSASGTLGTSIAEIQQILTDLGFYSGPIDGRYSTETIAAIRAFQTELGVPATGIIDVPTIQAIHARGVEQGVTSVTTTTTTVPPTTTTTTKPPATEPPATDVPTVPPTEAPPTAAPPTEPPTTPTTPATTLYDVLSGNKDYSTFIEIVNAAGYNADIENPSPLTVFAPNNVAFAAIPGAELEKLRNGRDRGQDVAGPARRRGGHSFVEADDRAADHVQRRRPDRGGWLHDHRRREEGRPARHLRGQRVRPRPGGCPRLLMDDPFELVESPPALADYLRLRSESGLSPKSEAQGQGALDGTWCFVHVRHRQTAEVVAMGHVIGDGGWYFHIADMAVLPSHQRQGLGRKVLQHLLDRVEEAAPDEPWITLLADPPGIALYEQMGFLPTAPGSVGMSWHPPT